MKPSFERFERLRRRSSDIGSLLRDSAAGAESELGLAEVLDLLQDIAEQWPEQATEPDSPPSAARGPGRLGALVAEGLGRDRIGRLCPEHRQVLHFNDFFFRRVVSESGVDPVAVQVLSAYQPAMAAAWLAFPRALFAPASPARQLLELLARIGRGLDAYSGRAAGRVSREMRRVALCGGGACGDQAAYVDASRAFGNFLHGYQGELAVHEQRLMAREHGREIVQDAHLVVAREIRRAIAGRVLPRLVPDFLQETWSKYLRVTYLREGMDSQAWTEGIEVIRTLVWSVGVRDPKVLQDSYKTRINPLLERLHAGVSSIHPEGKAYRSFLRGLDAVHMAIMAGEEPSPAEQVSIPPLDPAPDSAEDGGARAQHFPEIRTMRPGDWYAWNDGFRSLRCRLVENNQRHAYLLFANLSGIKVVRLDYGEAASALQGGGLRRLDLRPVFDRAAALALDDWEAALARWESEVRDRALAGESRLPAAQGRAHAADEPLRAQASAETARRQEEARERAVARTAEALRRMQPGGVVELIDDGERRITCRLALVLRSTRRLFFVDDLGRKVAALMPEDLAARIVEGSAQILDYGLGFDEPLQSLIEGRSQSMRED
jgi:hypothetical protein